MSICIKVDELSLDEKTKPKLGEEGHSILSDVITRTVSNFLVSLQIEIGRILSHTKVRIIENSYLDATETSLSLLLFCTNRWIAEKSNLKMPSSASSTLTSISKDLCIHQEKKENQLPKHRSHPSNIKK